MTADPDRFDDVNGWHHNSCRVHYSSDDCDCGSLRAVFECVLFDYAWNGETDEATA